MFVLKEDDVQRWGDTPLSRSIIDDLDKYKWGWGNGKAKKELIMPIITALALRAQEAGIDSKEFKEICIRELDATFYTKENIIKEQIKAMYERIIQSGM